MRMMGDMQELDLPENCRLILPDKDDLMKFSIMIKPDTGYWKGASYTFTFDVNDQYPYKPPKVKCIEKVTVVIAELTASICYR